MLTVDPTERRVMEELRSWSAIGLETPNDYFNNLPPCPFAHQAWSENKVAILFKREDSYQTLYSAISQFDDQYDLAILVDLYDLPDSDTFHGYLHELNKAIADGFFIDKDIWLMGFHPDDDVPDFVDDTMDLPEEIVVEDEYTLVFIQRLSKLQESAYKLVKKGYYDNYVQHQETALQYAERETFYLNLKGRNHGTSQEESSCQNAGRWSSQEESPCQNARRRTSQEESPYAHEEGWFRAHCQ